MHDECEKEGTLICNVEWIVLFSNALYVIIVSLEYVDADDGV